MVNGQAFHLGLRTQKCDLQTQGVWETWKGGRMDGHGQVGRLGIFGRDGMEEENEPNNDVFAKQWWGEKCMNMLRCDRYKSYR